MINEITLTPEAIARRELLEKRVSSALVVAWSGLLEIKRQRLWLDYRSFNKYLQARWNMHPNTAQYVSSLAMRAEEILSEHGVLLANQNAVRAMMRIDSDMLAVVMSKAREISGGVPVTAKALTQAADAVAEVTTELSASGHCSVDGEMLAIDAAVSDAVRERVLAEREQMTGNKRHGFCMARVGEPLQVYGLPDGTSLAVRWVEKVDDGAE